MEFLNHLQSTCGGLHTITLLALQSTMQTAHKECDGILQGMNVLWDAIALFVSGLHCALKGEQVDGM